MTEVIQTMKVTMYGWPDNDPPGAGIAYPTLHSQAGGTGTYGNPITMASAPGEFTPGTKVYVPYLHKYFIMEDYCADATSEWQSSIWHIDLWADGNSSSNVNQLLSAEYEHTRSSATVIINPNSNYSVDTTPFYTNGSTATAPMYADTIPAPIEGSGGDGGTGGGGGTTTLPPTDGKTITPLPFRIVGTSGSDNIRTDNKSHVIQPGLGSDKVNLGTGYDAVVYNSLAEVTGDIIYGFDQAKDWIDLSKIDANSKTNFNDAFTFNDMHQFTHRTRELIIYTDTRNTYVDGDVNGDGIGDFHLTLSDIYMLTPEGFVL